MDLTKPIYKGEIQVANPNSSGTAYTTLATILQIFGEDKGWDYMKKPVSYTHLRAHETV